MILLRLPDKNRILQVFDEVAVFGLLPDFVVDLKNIEVIMLNKEHNDFIHF